MGYLYGTNKNAVESSISFKEKIPKRKNKTQTCDEILLKSGKYYFVFAVITRGKNI